MNTPLLTCAATCQTEHPESQSNVCFVFVTYSWMEMCSMCAQRNYVFDMVASIWINDEYFRRSSKWTFASRTDFNLFFFSESYRRTSRNATKWTENFYSATANLSESSHWTQMIDSPDSIRLSSRTIDKTGHDMSTDSAGTCPTRNSSIKFKAIQWLIENVVKTKHCFGGKLN